MCQELQIRFKSYKNGAILAGVGIVSGFSGVSCLAGRFPGNESNESWVRHLTFPRNESPAHRKVRNSGRLKKKPPITERFLQT